MLRVKAVKIWKTCAINGRRLLIQKDNSFKYAIRELHPSIASYDKFESVLGGPKIRSPFGNPNKVRQGSSIDKELHINTALYNKQDTPSSKDEPEKVVPLHSVKKAPIFNRTLQKDASGPENPASEDNPDLEKKRQRTARNTYLGLSILLGSTVVGLAVFCFNYGMPERDAEGNVIPDEFTDKPFGFFYRILNSFKLWRDYVVEPSRAVLLPDPIPYPYHQPKYTLVIEMKNILVSPEWTYKTGYRFKKRPALDYFLDVVGYPNFEVVIYTSESSMTAPSVVEAMDPKGRIMYKLYRDTTKYMNGHHVKDLSKLNRDLSKVIYIDFDPNSFQLNPDNVLCLPKWEGNMEDTSLVDLAELLKTIHLSDIEDVRPTLQYYSQFDDPVKEFRRRAQYVAEQEEKKYEKEDNQSGLKKYAGKLFGFKRHNSA